MSQGAPTAVRRFSATPDPTPLLSYNDVRIYFRVLRFLAAHPEWTAEATPDDSFKATTPAATNGASPAADAAPCTSSSPPLPPRTAQTTSSSLRLPPALRDPLEAYRRAFTARPLCFPDIAVARQRVQDALTALRGVSGVTESEADDTAAAAATNAVVLRDVVFADDGDALIESDSRELAKGSFMTSWGPRFAGQGRRLCNNDEMQEIVPGLWCGSWRPASTLPVLQAYGITHICCCIDTRPHFSAELVYWKIPAVDTPGYNMEPHFAAAFDFIDAAVVAPQSNVLVHCGAGISRAPTIVASYLMKKLRVGSLAAVQLVRHHRSVASPNAGFREQLREYGRRLRIEAGAAEAEEEGDSPQPSRTAV